MHVSYWSAGGYSNAYSNNMNTMPCQWPPDYVQNDYALPGKLSSQLHSSSKNHPWPPKYQYPCQALPASGPKAYNADTHNLYKRNNNGNEQPADAETDANRSLVCDICEQRFASPSAMLVHTRWNDCWWGEQGQ